MGLILLVLSIAPVMFFAFEIYKRDFDKEPRSLLIKLFLSGIGSAFLTLLLSSILTKLVPFFGYNTSDISLIELIPYVFLGVALIEEFSKWIFVYTMEYNDNEYNHLYDGIVFAAFVSLGFACFENILYVMQSGGFDEGVRVAFIRAVLAIPGHLCDGIMMGYYLSMSKLANANNNPVLKKKNLILSLVVPVVAHGIYDYLLFACDTAQNDRFLILFFAFVICFFMYSYKKVKQLSCNTFNLNPNYITINERKKIETMNQMPVMNSASVVNNSYVQSVYNPNIQYGYPNSNVNNMSYEQQSQNNTTINNSYAHTSTSKKNFCTNCGTPAKGKFCSTCGKEL